MVQRAGMVVAVCLLLPAVAGAATPEQIAKRLATAPNLSAAVQATEDALARGGITIVQNGAVKRRGAAPQAPIAVTGTEVLNLAYEAMGKRTAGGTTLAALAAQLRSARFPYGKRKQAAASLQKFLGLWVRADRRSKAPRAFAPRFLAAMAKRQGRPVDLVKGNYPPAQLHLTKLEVQLLIAGLKRGPQRLWKGHAPRVAHAAQDDTSPCSDFRKFQKAYLEEAFDKDVAADLDKILDYGFGMIADEISKPVIEKGVAAGIEQGILHNRWRARPGQRATRLSAKWASKAMTALDILLKVQKLAVLYGSTDIEVRTQDDVTVVHKPNPDRKNIGFAAFAGITPEKAAEYQALRDQRATESDFVKAFRDCLKLLKLPSLTDTGDIAEELEKWRVKWSYQLLTSHAEPDVQHTKYDAGFMKQQLKRINDYDAWSGYVFVWLKPERDQDHEGCNPPLRSTYVSATAALDTSQAPDLGTAINAITGNVFGVALEAAEQILRSALTPSATGTVKVTFHVPDKTRAAGGGFCGADITAHVESGIQCQGQEQPVLTDVFDVSGSSKSGTGTVNGHHNDFFNGNGCENVGNVEVRNEPTEISVTEDAGRLYVSWAPQTTGRWVRFVDVPAASGTYTITNERGDADGRYVDTITLTVALSG